MIVASDGERIRVVNQADHARLAASILSLFRLPRLVEHPRRELLLRAVAEHDNGWWESDSAPELDPDTGAPRDFRRFSVAAVTRLLERGVERFADDSPYVAALVATHALRELDASRREGVEDATREQITLRRNELLAAAALSPEELEADAAWLALADELALAAVTGNGSLVTSGGYRASVRQAPDLTELALAPFPLAGATRIGVACREIAPGRSASGAELARRLLTASWREHTVRLAPLSPL